MHYLLDKYPSATAGFRATGRGRGGYRLLSCTIARMPARTAGGRLDEASTTAARSRSAGSCVVVLVVTSRKHVAFSGETGSVVGLQIRHRRFDSDRSLFLFSRLPPSAERPGNALEFRGLALRKGYGHSGLRKTAGVRVRNSTFLQLRGEGSLALRRGFRNDIGRRAHIACGRRLR